MLAASYRAHLHDLSRGCERVLAALLADEPADRWLHLRLAQRLLAESRLPSASTTATLHAMCRAECAVANASMFMPPDDARRASLRGLARRMARARTKRAWVCTTARRVIQSAWPCASASPASRREAKESVGRTRWEQGGEWTNAAAAVSP